MINYVVKIYVFLKDIGFYKITSNLDVIGHKNM